MSEKNRRVALSAAVDSVWGQNVGTDFVLERARDFERYLETGDTKSSRTRFNESLAMYATKTHPDGTPAGDHRP